MIASMSIDEAVARNTLNEASPLLDKRGYRLYADQIRKLMVLFKVLTVK